MINWPWRACCIENSQGQGSVDRVKVTFLFHKEIFVIGDGAAIARMLKLLLDGTL